jgi:hypothetical protein
VVCWVFPHPPDDNTTIGLQWGALGFGMGLNIGRHSLTEPKIGRHYFHPNLMNIFWVIQRKANDLLR